MTGSDGAATRDAGAPVVTLTAAGAIDVTYRVGQLALGTFTRAVSYTREMSGKGVNVSAALALAGRPTAAVVVLGHDDLEFATGSAPAGILRPVTVPGATRVNTSIIDAAGETTKVNAPTVPLARSVWDQVVAATLAELDREGAGWLVVSGTLPPLEGQAEPADVTALLAGARVRRVRVALDSSGPALVRALSHPSVAIVKPNATELAELTGRSLRTLGEVVHAARTLTVPVVYASLGADGVLVVTATQAIHAHATALRLANTAGAGDASLAGFLVGLGDGALDDLNALGAAASTAASWGAHAVAQESTILPALQGMPRAAVTHTPSLATPLSEPALA